MLRAVLCWIFGSAIIIATGVDVVWTALGTHGGGPISGPLTAWLWDIATAAHKRWPHHRRLSFIGSVLLACLLLFWTMLVWAGGTLIFEAVPRWVMDTQTGQPATLIGRAYFVGATIFTAGSSEVVARGGVARLLSAIVSGLGIGVLTLSVTFVLQVLAAVVEKRKVGAYISDIGGTPSKIISLSWTGEEFDSLTDHLLSLASMMHTFTEQHLAYPIVLYFHSENERAAATLRIAALHELLMLLGEGVAPEKRLPPLVLGPVREALKGLAEVMAGQYIDPPRDPPPMTPLSILRDRGIPTVDDQTYARAVEEARDTRRVLCGLLEYDGWPWERIYETKSHL